MRITYPTITGTSSYKCSCKECGKTLRRTAKVAQTLNPFNKNDDGDVKGYSQIREEVDKEAKQLASSSSGSLVTCSHCAEKPYRELLIQMNVFDYKVPERNPDGHRHTLSDVIHILMERGHVQRERIDEETCASCNHTKYAHGYSITSKGRKRANSFSVDDIKSASDAFAFMKEFEPTS